MSTLSARAVLGVNAPISQSLTRLRTLQKLGFGDLDFARGPPLSLVFLVPVAFLVPVPFTFGAGVLSLVAGTARFTLDMLTARSYEEVLILLSYEILKFSLAFSGQIFTTEPSNISFTIHLASEIPG